MATTDWPVFEDMTPDMRQAEVAYFARVDAAEAYGAYIERMADELGDEPFEDWDVPAALTRAHDAPYDHDPRPAERGFTAAERVALKADALRFAVAHDAPLVDPFTGAEIDRRNCAA